MTEKTVFETLRWKVPPVVVILLGCFTLGSSPALCQVITAESVGAVAAKERALDPRSRSPLVNLERQFKQVELSKDAGDHVFNILPSENGFLDTPSGQAQGRDIAGTWITQVAGSEVVLVLRTDNGHISGQQSNMFGDFPIVGGKIQGDQFELTVRISILGSLENATAKGTIVGDKLQVSPAMPVMPDVFNEMAPKGPGGERMRRIMALFGGPLMFSRGTPSAPEKAPVLDWASIPKVELPSLQAVGYNGLADLPPMGWSSWNKFQLKIDDKTIRDTADAMVSSGLRDAGYVYVNIDDGWQGTRDEHGVIRSNSRFPDMKALAGYVHSKGLKLGLYSSPGPRTCGGFEGSYGHESQDAKTWAAWGVDYVKYDWCSAAQIWTVDQMRAAYQLMGSALRRIGRPIVYGLCQYGLGHVEEWGPLVGANLWRTTTDLINSWDWMANIGFSQSDLAPYAGHGHWNDPDALIIGNGGMSPVEDRTQFSLWAILAAPLVASNDVRNMSTDTREILLNKEVIAIDQDALAKAGHRVERNGDTEVWIKPLIGNSYAIGLFNRGTSEATVRVPWADAGFEGQAKVRDLWVHTDRGSIANAFDTAVPSHGVVLIRVTPTP